MTLGSKIKIEVSNRHIHLSQEHINILFGKDYELNKYKELSQTGHFAAKEKIALVHKDKRINNIRILGPPRKESQVEISRTDSFYLKLNVPLRHSGDLDESPGVLILGPKGKIKLKKGVIIAQRHIHISPEESKKLNLKNNQKVNLKVSGEKEIIFNNVIIRVNNDFNSAFHIDFDEANACFFQEGMCAEII
jgi:putative phosphotransacetylase